VAIAVHADGGNGHVAPAGAHRNICLEGNAVSQSTNPAIAVTSTTDLKLGANHITSPDNAGLLPWLLDDFGRNTDPNREIYLLNNRSTALEVELPADGRKEVAIWHDHASSRLFLTFADPSGGPFSIFDLRGKEVFSSATSAAAASISTSEWIAGVYLLRLASGKSIKFMLHKN
jgi:hypothetical protein